VLEDGVVTAPEDLQQLSIGLLGGTGPQGSGLARRFAAAGLHVLVGSRDAAKAVEAAQQLGAGVRGVDNATCAAVADIVVVAVPWDAHADLLSGLADELAGKVVVDCVNPLGFDDRGPYPLDVAEGSAAEQAQALLPQSRIVAAFHHVSAVHLNDGDTDVDCDSLVLGDDREATDLVRALVEVVPGMRGIYAGRLRNAGQVEALTANIIAVNRRYRTSAGIRITGV
jgi:hypothetical protein